MEVTLGSPKSPTVETVESALLDSASASANEIEPTIDSSKSKSGPITLQTNGDNPMGSSVQLQTGSPPADQPASTLNPTDESSSSNLLTIGHLPDRQNPTSCNGSGVSNVDYLKPGGSPADAPTNQINDIVLPENPLPLEDTSFLDTVPLEESNFDLGEDDQLNDGIDGDSDVGETKLEAETTEDLQECVQAINEAEKKEAEPEESRSEGVGNDTATCNDVNQAAGAGESRPEEVCSKETSLGEAKVEPDGKECAGQVRHTEEARSAESMGETKEYAVRQESAAGVQPNGLRDEEVAQDIETMRSNIVEAMDDFQTRIDEAKEIKLNLENLLRNLNSIKSIDVQNKDLRADLVDNRTKLEAAKTKVEYDNRLANEIRVWWTASKASMIEKAQTDLTEIIEGTTELSSQLLCETKEIMKTFELFESTIKKKTKRKRNHKHNHNQNNSMYNTHPFYNTVFSDEFFSFQNFQNNDPFQDYSSFQDNNQLG